MAKNRTKKTDQDAPWNRRKEQTRVYALDSRLANTKRFLIICEGKNTEPAYFQSFPVVTAEVKVYGTGRSKTSLVQHVVEVNSQDQPDEEREIWIVFDMDHNALQEASLQRSDFNQAIRLAEKHGFKVAYSNDAFELWLVLHYQLLESVLTRTEYYEQISRHWNISYEKAGKSHSLCQNIYQRLLDDQNADQTAAIRHAERLYRQQAHLELADQNPCTTVYQLVNELNKHLKK